MNIFNSSRVLRSCAGATSIEYALVAALVAVAIVASLTTLGGSVLGLFSQLADLTG